MPPLEFVPGIARVVWEGTFSGVSNWAVIHHIGRRSATGDPIETGPWDTASINALANEMSSLWQVRFRTLVHTSVSLVSTSATDLSNATGVVGINTANVLGTLTGSACPVQTAQCISWREALHYRGGHLRSYLPYPSTSQLATITNTWSSAHVTNVETASNAYLADLLASTVSANGLALVGVHRVRSHALLIPPIVTVVTGASFDQRVDTQRRRLGPDV